MAEITGKFLYDAYRKAAGYKSKYTGDDLPEFEDVEPVVQGYWNQTAADANAEYQAQEYDEPLPLVQYKNVSFKPKPMRERPDGGPIR